MDLKFSKMSVDTTLAQEYLKMHNILLPLNNDYNGTIELLSKYGEDFLLLTTNTNNVEYKGQTAFKTMASKLKQNATLIAQLEYHVRNIPIEETHAQLNLLIQYFRSWPNHKPLGLDSGTVAVVSDDADVDSAVDKLISVSKQAPWRLRRILVQESVYQEFKEALTWKCKLNESRSKAPTHKVLCSDTLTYNDRTFLIDPVELTEEHVTRGVVTVEAYRTTKEMISLVQQYEPRYLSLWINGVAEINEVTHSTIAPVVWVNTVADFRGPPQISHAVFSYYDAALMKKCDKAAKLCELSQSWLKLDFESRRDILCGLLDNYILLDSANKLYTDIRNSISSCTQKSFVDVGKDYICIGMLQPKGIIATFDECAFLSVKGFESILQGNALIVNGGSSPHYPGLEQAGVPVANINIKFDSGDMVVSPWDSSYFMRTRVVWTNSGTIFAN